MYLQLFLTFIIILSTLQLQAKDQVMGYLTTNLSYFKYKDAQIAFQFWLDELAEKKGVTLEIKYYDNAQKALKDYETHKLDAYSLNTIYYLQNMKQLDPLTMEFWAMLESGNIPDRLLILVSSESNIKNIADLKNRVIEFKDDDLMAKLFLEKELLQTQHKAAKKYMGNYHLTRKDSTALLDTFFKKCDVCIVPESTLNMAVELNPALKKRLRILKASPRIFIPSIMLIHTKTPKELRMKLRQSVADLDKTPKGRNIKEFLRLENFSTVTPKYMNLLREYYQEYLKLQARYNHE